MQKVEIENKIRELESELVSHKTITDTLKISVNGSFGKLGSKYSALYAPELLIQTTITGQLALLMLIERMEARGVSIRSANTDGIVCQYARPDEAVIDEVAFDWMLDTSYELERSDYRVLASRDVNNYVAITASGKVKGKGLFAKTGISKNPDCEIVAASVAKCLADGTPPEITIKACQDIRKFCTVRRVTGGAVWRYELLGKAVRFYLSNRVPEDEAIRYVKNSNIVPKSSSARPLMEVPETFPDDVDYAKYIVAAEKLLCEVGYA